MLKAAVQRSSAEIDLKKICKIWKKCSVVESYFSTVQLELYNFTKKDSATARFMMNFQKSFKMTFLQKPL